MEQAAIIAHCKTLLAAYRDGTLGYMKMPEDAHPPFSAEQTELRLAYFTLPMSLNYQRDSYTLWESALKTFNDPETRVVFDIRACASLDTDTLRRYLLKYKVALQPNKHIATWHTIAKTISTHWGSMGAFLHAADGDFLTLQRLVQVQHKKEFPYLSGPKIFHYWSFIIQEYGKISLKNAEFIEIAPDTHITKCSVRLGVLTADEATSLTREEISKRWRTVLSGSGITPIEMHPPCGFGAKIISVFLFSP